MEAKMSRKNYYATTLIDIVISISKDFKDLFEVTINDVNIHELDSNMYPINEESEDGVSIIYSLTMKSN